MKWWVLGISINFLAGCLPGNRANVEGYVQYLKSQNKHRERLPPLFKEGFQKDFSFDIDDIWYAERVETLTGQAVTIDRTIYYPGKVPVKGHDFVKSILHELIHVKQQEKYGQLFFEIYGAQAFLSTISAPLKGKVSITTIHDDVGMEKEALDLAVLMHSQVKLDCPRNNCLLSPLNKSSK